MQPLLASRWMGCTDLPTQTMQAASKCSHYQSSMQVFENLIQDQLDLSHCAHELLDPDVELDHVFD